MDVTIRDLTLTPKMAAFLLDYAEFYQNCVDIPWGYGSAFPLEDEADFQVLVDRSFGKLSRTDATTKLVEDGVDAKCKKKFRRVPDRTARIYFHASYGFEAYAGELAQLAGPVG